MNDTPPPSSGRDRAAVVDLTLFFVAVGVCGVDYGDQHWDEPSNVKQLVWALQHRAPFPRWYYYPSGLMMALGVAAVPEMVMHGLDGAPAALMELPYRLRARALLVVLTALAVPATFVLARRARCSTPAALFAAALVATSFQLQTHARFIAPNGILVAVIALWAVALTSVPRPAPAAPALGARLATAALLGGVVAGVKYSAGIVALPLAIAAWRAGGTTAARAWRVVVTGALALCGFLLTTPGALFEPELLLRGLEFQRVVYGDGWIGHTVDGPLAMAKAMAGYLAFALLSPVSALACVLVVVALVGAVRLVRDPALRATWLLWVFPLLHAVLFLGQRVFADRNVLPLLPFAAVLVALGADAIAAGLSSRLRARSAGAPRGAAAAVGALGAAAVVVNAAYAVHAAGTILDRRTDRFVRELAAFVAEHRDEELLVSPRVRAALAAAGAPDGHFVSSPTPRTTGVLAYPEELHREWMWPCTDPFLVERVFGPLEVEWRYAPTWRGTPRVVLLDIDKARAIGASLTFTPDEGPGPPRMPMELLGR